MNEVSENKDKNKVKHVLHVVLTLITVLLSFIGSTMIVAVFEQFDFIRKDICDEGIQRINPSITGIIFAITVLVLFVVLFCLSKKYDNQSEPKISQLEETIWNYKMKEELNKEYSNLILNVSKYKLMKKMEQINKYQENNTPLNFYTDAEYNLNEIISNLVKSVNNILTINGYQMNEDEGELSVSIAYLFDPPEEIKHCFLDPYNKEWKWIKNNNPGSLDVTSYTEKDEKEGRQSTLRHTIVDLKDKSYLKNKVVAHRKREYKKSGKEKLRGTIYCSPLKYNFINNNKPVVVAAINISTRTTSFANNNEVRLWLDFCTKSLGNQIKSELFNLYIDKKLNNNIVKFEQEQKTEANE